MKKLIIVSIALSLFSLTGCNSKGLKDPGYFKDYTFNCDYLKGMDKTALEEEVMKNLASISSYDMIVEQHSKTNVKEEHLSGKVSVKIGEDTKSKDNFIMFSNMEVSQKKKENSVTFEQNIKQEIKEWDAGNGLTFVNEKLTTNKEKKEIYYASPYEGTSADNKADRLDNLRENYFLPRLETDLMIFKKTDGSYIAIYSTIYSRNHPYSDNNVQKDRVKIERTQNVLEINKNHRLVSYHYYEDLKTNKDPDTGEWYDSLRLVSYNYGSVKYGYDKRQSDNIGSLNKAAGNRQYFYSTSLYGDFIRADFDDDTRKYSVNEASGDKRELMTVTELNDGYTHLYTTFDLQPEFACRLYIKTVYIDINGITTDGLVNIDLKPYSDDYVVPYSVGSSSYLINTYPSRTVSVSVDISFDGKSIALIDVDVKA